MKLLKQLRSAGPVEEVREARKNRFDLSEIKSKVTLDMQLHELLHLKTEKIELEYNELKEIIKDLN